MSNFQQDTYTSSEEEDYVFEEPNKEEVQPIEKKKVEKVQPVEKVQHVEKKVEKSTEEQIGNGFSFDLDENDLENDQNEAGDDSSESEYEEVVVRKKVKKKKSKKRAKKKPVQNEANLSDKDKDIILMTDFVNQFEGIDPNQLILVSL